MAQCILSAKLLNEVLIPLMDSNYTKEEIIRLLLDFHSSLILLETQNELMMGTIKNQNQFLEQLDTELQRTKLELQRIRKHG